MATSSNGLKSRFIGRAKSRLAKTRTGATKRAICVLEPFFKVTGVAVGAAAAVILAMNARWGWSLACVLGDGEFGDRSTGRMPDPGCFIALTEYRPGRGLEPGRGLFEPRKVPLPLDPAGFSASRLAHPRRGQVGAQHFFTTHGRPLCLYVVLAGTRPERRRRLLAVDRLLRSLEIAARA